MNIVIASKNNEKTFSDTNILNIGTTANCNYKMNLPFDIVISLQKHANGKWRVINTTKSNKILFKGQPIGTGVEITSMCKLKIDGSDEFITIKIIDENMELVNLKKTIKHQNAVSSNQTNSKHTNTSIKQELSQQDIENVYGKGSEGQTRLKIDNLHAEIEKRRSLVTREISFKCRELRARLSQHETILGVFNIFVFVIPLVMAYILNSIDKIELNFKFVFLSVVAFIVLTALLKQAQFLTLRTHSKRNVNPSLIRIKSMCFIVSIGSFATIILFSITELITHAYSLPDKVPIMLLFCSFLCIFVGIFSGFTKNIIAESDEELNSYESREDYVSVIKDYQEWINLFINNISRKKLRDINNKIFYLQISCVGEYLLGIATAPFLAYGVSQTLAGYFPEAAGFINITQTFRFSPIFLTLATLMIIFAFHCFAVSFYTTKRIHASNVIKQDGYSDYNSHGVMIHGVESTKNLQKEAKKFLVIAICVVFVEIVMNTSYFIKDADDIQSILMALLSASIPTVLLIMETNMVSSTKFKINLFEELLDRVDKEY